MARADHPSLGPRSRACKNCGDPIPADSLLRFYCSDACALRSSQDLLNRIRHFQARKRAALDAEESTPRAEEPARARQIDLLRCFWCGSAKPVVAGVRACPMCDHLGMWARWETRRGEFEGLLRWYEERPYDYERDGEADG